MSNIKSAKKDIIKSKNSRKYNIKNKSIINTYVKKIQLLIIKGNKKKAQILFNNMQPIIDRQIHKGIIHKNKVARYKSKLILKIKNI